MLLPPRTRISALWVYPVKAMQGVSVAEAELTASGTLRFDREWCVVDRDGDRYPALQSLSQRLCPVLASVAVKLPEPDTCSQDAPASVERQMPSPRNPESPSPEAPSHAVPVPT